MKRIAAALLALLPFGIAVSEEAAPATGVVEFKVDDAWGRDTVQFRTTAPLEDIVGTTTQVTGLLKADPKNLKGPSTTARLEVDVASLRTGIEMRDGAVAKTLGAEKNPVAVFTLEKVKSASANTLEPNVSVDIVAEGIFELKGVKKKVDVTAKITSVPKGGPFNRMRPGNFVKVVADFDVKLADFGIDRNGPVLPLQVGETAHVTVTALASDAGAEEADAYRQNAIKYMGKARK